MNTKRALHWGALIPAFLISCSKVEEMHIADTVYIYGAAAENTDIPNRMSMTPVYDVDNIQVEGSFEVYLCLDAGSFIVNDSDGNVWTLTDDGNIVKDGGESTAADPGLCRIRIDLKNMKWSKTGINSISFHPFFSGMASVPGQYEGRGKWSFQNLMLGKYDNEIRYYRFDVDSDKPEELAYLVYTNDVNDKDPKSYISEYQYVRAVGKDEIDMKDDGSTASWRLKSVDEGPFNIELRMYQPRPTHYVDILEPRAPAAFIGDSITARWNSSDTGYPEFFSINSYLNFGISGQTSRQIRNRFMNDVVANNPICTVILCGTNDIAGNQGTTTNDFIMGNITAMADMAEEAGIKVILCSILPCDRYSWRPEVEPRDRIDDMNRRIRKFAEDRGFLYVDYFSVMADNNRALKKEFQADSCHPNQKGYDVMERIVKPVIDKALE